MTLIVGLGNPDKIYLQNRHNVGFMAIDYIIDSYNPIPLSKKSIFKGELFKKGDFLLLKPETYMNLSGEAVLAVKNYYKPNKIIVIYDDIDIPLGSLRFKKGGSSGGHNGIKSIDKLIGNDYIRVRIGIGRPKYGDVVKFVLSNFLESELTIIKELFPKIFNAIQDINRIGLDKVVAKYTIKKPNLC